MLRFASKLFLILFALAAVNKSLLGQTGYISLPDTAHWQVTVDDTILLSSEKCTIPVPAGRHELFIQPVNNKNWLIKAQNKEVFVQEAETLRVNPTVPKFHSSLLTDGSLDHSKKTPGKQKFRSNTQKYFKPAVLATAVAANWASFYVKRKADDYYKIYQKSSDLDKIDKYYNKAADFDAYANILLGVSAAALTVYFYYLMTD